MDRRNFIGALLALGAGFSILPPATTYARIWQVTQNYSRDYYFQGWVTDALQERPDGVRYAPACQLWMRKSDCVLFVKATEGLRPVFGLLTDEKGVWHCDLLINWKWLPPHKIYDHI